MQGTFAFYEALPPRPRRPERLFFGLFPDAEAALRFSRFGDRFVAENGLPGSRLERERLHVSLHHVGDYARLRTRFVHAACRAAAAVAMAPFDVTFGLISSFDGTAARDGTPRRRPLVLLGESAPLLELHRALGAAMARNGLRPSAGITPHMTLLYGPKPVPRQPIAPIRFTAGELVLVHSRLGLSRYETVGRWPLAA